MTHHPSKLKKVPLWKWLIIIFLVIAMPLFFALARNIQLQQAINTTQSSSATAKASTTP